MEYVIVVATREMVENIIENEEVIYIVNDLLKLKLQTGGHKAKLKKRICYSHKTLQEHSRVSGSHHIMVPCS